MTGLQATLARGAVVASLALAAALVDVLPMLLRGASMRQAAVPFLHWIVTTVFISAVQWPLPPALRGALVALLCAAPTLVRYANEQPASVLPVAATSLVLGPLLGVLLARWA